MHRAKTHKSSQTSQKRWAQGEPLRKRLALSLAVGTIGGVFLTLIDASLARRGLAQPPTLLKMMAADAGVLLPFTASLGLAVGLCSFFVHGAGEPTVTGMLERLHAWANGRASDVAAFVSLAVLALFVWATASAHLARVVLGMPIAPLPCGAAIASGSLLIGTVCAIAALSATPWLRQKLAGWRSSFPMAVRPDITIAITLSFVAILVAVGVVTGDVSGGGGALGIYGILKRQELDLRAVGMLAALGLGTYLAPAMLRFIKAYQAMLVGVAPLLLWWWAAQELNHDPEIAQVIARGAPLGARPLSLWRKATDQDGDGASGWFGGGDCDDGDPTIGPAAKEIPDNGIDEDCSGSDLSLASLRAARSATGTGTETGSATGASVAKKESYAIPKRGNLVLITIDTLRHEMGYTGYAHNISPELDKLAARSTVFTHAYALASYTGKSIGPMLIGKYGSETHRNWGHFNIFGPDDTFMAQRIQSAYIKTIAVHGHRYFGNWGGLERGFDVLDMSTAPPKDAKWATDSRITSDKLTNAAIEQLKDIDDDGRFFLWVHYLDPHADYLRHANIESFGKNARAMYDGEVAFTDRHVGRLLDTISNASWAKRTNIIVTSDHGESFGEHKLWRHGFELWESLVRVPLIVHVPGAKPRRIDARRSLIDLVPTALQLLALKKPTNSGNDFVSGKSWLPDVYLEKNQKAERRDILIDMPAGPYNESRRSFIRNDLKLTISGGVRYELYDLRSDPGEQQNLWKTQAKKIEPFYALAKSRLRTIEVKRKRK